MRSATLTIPSVLAALLAAGSSAPAWAVRLDVEPGTVPLQAVVDAAAEGDTLVLLPGVHAGPVVLTHGMILAGEPGAVVQGSGRGSVVTVEAARSTVRGLVITGSGLDPDAKDAGVLLGKGATGAVVEENLIEGNLTGVQIHGARDAVVRRNRIVGLREGRINDSGNGVSVWNAPGAQVLDNDISFGRDGIFSISSRRNLYARNRMHDVRFAVHYMYTNDSEISGNISTGNAVGYALMFSNNLVVRDNVSDHDRDHGFVFNYANGSTVSGNMALGGPQPAERWASRGLRGKPEQGMAALEAPSQPTAAGPRIGPEKCVFIYNANQNRFRGNWFEGCEIGIHFTAGSEGNEVVGNAFVNNRNQVKYVGSRTLDWSRDGRGNFWSDNPGFDLDGDGIADTAYRPNDLVDKVLWTAPSAKILVNSPAVQVIRWAQSQFPAILPGGVLDSRPLISAPPRPKPVGPQP